MKVTKDNLVKGLIKFINDDLIPQVGDRNKKFVLAMAKDSLRQNENLIDEFMQNPMVSTLVVKDGDEYDVTLLLTILKNTLTEYESLSVAIPRIPIFSPTEKLLKITVEDIEKLIKYIVPAETTM